MQFKISKEEFSNLSEDIQKEYTLDGDNAVLKIEGEGAPTLAALNTAQKKFRIEQEHRQNAEKARDAAEQSAVKLREDLKNASGKDEIEKIRAQHEEAMNKINEEREAEKLEIKKERHSKMVAEKAKEISNRFKKPFLIEPLIAKELTVEDVNGQDVLRVLDENGSPSILSVNDLEKKWLDKKELSDMIIENVGSGGGAAPGAGGGAPGSKSLDEMSGTEEARFANENPEKYQQMISAQ